MANEFTNMILGAANRFFDLVTPELALRGPDLILLTLSMVAYGVFIYKFYRFIAKRDVFGFSELELQAEQRDSFIKLTHIVSGTFKYWVLFPIVVFFWFSGFSVLFFFMAKDLPTETILLISITFVTAIRITSYYTEDLSRDLAKLIPFALLGVAILDPGFFSVDSVMTRFSELAAFLPQLLAYFVYVVLVEWTLRVLLAIKHGLFGVNHSSDETKA